MRLKLPRPSWWKTVTEETGAPTTPAEGLQPQAEIGAMLRRRREELGLSLRDLANETRITTPVIEALERGWKDRLPERAYLASMLPQLERRLDLPAGCLEPVLPPRAAVRQMRSGGLRRFTPGSIDVFTTWQGSVVYAVVIVLSLLALNRQQQDLAQRNTESFEPVRADLRDLAKGGGPNRDDPDVASLRPLEQAERRELLDWLASDGGAANRSSGVLQVILTTPRQLQISSDGGDRLNLKGGSGTLTLQLLPPVELVIEPPPSEQDTVLWNGTPQQPDAKRKGLYRVEVPPSSAEAPASERPQTAPRSP